MHLGTKENTIHSEWHNLFNPHTSFTIKMVTKINTQLLIWMWWRKPRDGDMSDPVQLLTQRFRMQFHWSVCKLYSLVTHTYLLPRGAMEIVWISSALVHCCCWTDWWISVHADMIYVLADLSPVLCVWVLISHVGEIIWSRNDHVSTTPCAHLLLKAGRVLHVGACQWNLSIAAQHGSLWPR